MQTSLENEIDLKLLQSGQEPWSSGYGKRLTFQRLWVRILAQYTGWTFFTYYCCTNCNFCLKRPKINEKEAGLGPFKKNNHKTLSSNVGTIVRV